MKNNFPTPVFAGVVLSSKEVRIVIRNRKKIIADKAVPVGIDPVSTLLAFVREFSLRKKVNIISASYIRNRFAKMAASTLWINENISPFILKTGTPDSISEYALSQFDRHNSYIAKTKKGKVHTPFLVGLSEYEKITPPEKFKTILELANRLKGKKISYISATPQGGGVAIMRHALLRFYELLGLNINWYVVREDQDVFEITKKKFHNVFQDVSTNGEVLDQHDMDLYDKWSRDNYSYYKNVIKNSDLVMIDDPQPAGLIPFIKTDFTDKPVLFRLHIHMLSKLAEKSGTAQNVSWNFLYDKIRHTDLNIFHPVRSFVPRQIDKDKVVMMGATTDYFDGLNKHLSESQQGYFTKILNHLLEKSNQTPIDVTRPIITQVARFDPSKGIPDALEAFYKLRKKLKKVDGNIPQLVIAGNSSVDDPDGIPIYNFARKLISIKKYKNIKDDIKILRIPPNDFLLNTLMRICTVYIQLSHKEGFEDKITGALMKGRPVIVYRTGGMPLQVREGVSGFLADVGDTDAVSNYLYRLLTDKKLYHDMKIAAMENINPDMNTESNALYWLYLFNEILNNKRKDFNFRKLEDLISQKT